MSKNKDLDFCDLTKYDLEISEEELEILLSFFFEEDDWDRQVGPCKYYLNISNLFVSKEAAKIQINRILTGLRRIRNGFLEKQ